LWLCRCIECGAGKWNRPNGFKHVIRGKHSSQLPQSGPLSFNKTIQEYRNLKKAHEEYIASNGIKKDDDEVAKILVYKLNPDQY